MLKWLNGCSFFSPIFEWCYDVVFAIRLIAEKNVFNIPVLATKLATIWLSELIDEQFIK